jgi:hypothetical protein
MPEVESAARRELRAKLAARIAKRALERESVADDARYNVGKKSAPPNRNKVDEWGAFC